MTEDRNQEIAETWDLNWRITQALGWRIGPLPEPRHLYYKNPDVEIVLCYAAIMPSGEIDEGCVWDTEANVREHFPIENYAEDLNEAIKLILLDGLHVRLETDPDTRWDGKGLWKASWMGGVEGFSDSLPRAICNMWIALKSLDK